MASAEYPFNIIKKARRKLTETLQRDAGLTLHVARYYPFLTPNEFSSLIKDPPRSVGRLINIVLQKEESAHKEFLDFLENLRHVFPVLRPISEYFDDEKPANPWENAADPWESVMCGGSPNEEGLPKTVKPEVIWSSSKNSHEAYRLHSTGTGSIRCAYSKIAFETRQDATLTYQFDPWPKNLNEGKTEKLSIGGPLFIIEADPEEAVTTVYLPHILYLPGDQKEQVRIAHFVDGKVRLEKPDRVERSHVVLKNPKSCHCGVLLEKSSSEEETKVQAVARLYQVLRTPSPTFHLYLLPNDPSVQKNVHDHELRCFSERVEKPPATVKPLTLGSSFFLQKLIDVTVSPKEMEFRYLQADMEQQYLELYAEHMQDKLELILMEKDTDERVWEACVRQKELKSSESFGVRGPLNGSRKTVRDHLEHILEDLEEEELKRFKNKLHDFPVNLGFDNIPRGRLQKADVQDLSQLLLEFYEETNAVPVTVKVLRAINLRQQANKLLSLSGLAMRSYQRNTSTSEENVHSQRASVEANKDVIKGRSTQEQEEKAHQEPEGRQAKADEDAKSSFLPEAKGRTTTLNEVLYKFKLQKHKSKKLALRQVLEISSGSLKKCTPQTLEDLPWHFLRKVLALNVTARSTSLEQGELDFHNERGKEEGKVFDERIFFTSKMDESNSMNPLDVLCAVLLCSDTFLQQEILSKMSLCQFALPLLLPPLETPECTLMLWAMRDIVKTWRPHSLADSTGFREESLVLASMPTISFVRMGSPSLSKSKLLNEFLSPAQQHHDFFMHRDMECGNLPREIADGLIEMAWYFPGGQKGLDLFSEPIAVANLHGDTELRSVQFCFLTQVSSALFIIAECIGEREYALLASLKKSSVPYYFILDRDSSKFNEIVADLKGWAPRLELSSSQILVKSASTNKAEFVEKLRHTVGKIINSYPQRISMERMAAVARGLAILVDEDRQDCQFALRCAEEITREIKDVANYKERTLKLQGYLWKNLAEVEKELCRMQRRGSRLSEEYRTVLKGRLLELHKKRNECHLTSGLVIFINRMKNLQPAEKQYFLKWMAFNLHHITRENLAKLEQDYKEKRKRLGDKNEIIKEMDRQITSSYLGVEHFMRELGQLYEEEYLLMREGRMTKGSAQFVDLPSVTADLMLEGFPLELIDGDASYISVHWITDVLTELNKKVRSQSKMMVISMLEVQRAGKSTLLNTMFGLRFAVHSSQSTRGAFMTFFKVTEDLAQELGCDFILVIDTEGLKTSKAAKSEGNYQHDNEMATLVIGLSDIAIMNIAMENAAEMKDILQIVTRTFLRMERTGRKPICQFVHQNISDVSANEQNMRDRKRLLEQLNEMTQAAAKIENIRRNIKFSDIMDYDPEMHTSYIPGLWNGVPPMAPVSRGYSEKVFELKKHFFEVIRQCSGKRTPRDIPQFIECVESLWSAVKHETIFSI